MISILSAAATRVSVLLTAGVIVVLVASQAHAQSADRTEIKARESFAAGRYDEALTLFAKLYAETLHPVYLRNIGRCQQKMREPQKAIDTFRDYIAKSRKMSHEERMEIEGFIKEMEALREGQAKQGDTSSGAPTGGPPPRAQTTTSPSTIPSASPVTTVSNPPPPQPQANLLVAKPAPVDEEAPLYKKWWFWTGIGVVAAGAIVTAILLSGGVDRPACDVEVCQ
jgi:hypothetical protein